MPITTKPEGVGVIGKSAKISGMVSEAELRQKIADIKQSESDKTRMQALQVMMGWTQSKTILSDLLAVEDGIALAALEKARDHLRVVDDTPLADGTTTAESSWACADTIIQKLMLERGQQLEMDDELAQVRPTGVAK